MTGSSNDVDRRISSIKTQAPTARLAHDAFIAKHKTNDNKLLCANRSESNSSFGLREFQTLVARDPMQGRYCILERSESVDAVDGFGACGGRGGGGLGGSTFEFTQSHSQWHQPEPLVGMRVFVS